MRKVQTWVWVLGSGLLTFALVHTLMDVHTRTLEHKLKMAVAPEYNRLHDSVRCLLFATQNTPLCPTTTPEQAHAQVQQLLRPQLYPRLIEVEAEGQKVTLASLSQELATLKTPYSLSQVIQLYQHTTAFAEQANMYAQHNYHSLRRDLNNQTLFIQFVATLFVVVMVLLWHYSRERLQLERRKASLQRQFQQEVSAIASHELRRPLQQVLLAADLLSNDSLSAETRASLMTRLGSSVKELTVLTDLKHLEDVYVHLELEKKSVDIRHVLQELSQKNPRVQCILPLSPVVMDVDPMRFQQIITNVIENALKYTPHYLQVDIGLFVLGRDITICIRDYGDGIPEAEQKKIFEPFYRVSKDQNGWGLGLAVVKRFVEAHRGTIEVQCPESGGTQFNLCFPKGLKLGHPSKDLPSHSMLGPLSS